MQDTSPKKSYLDMDKWREILDAWSKSGERQKNFCERQGLNWNTFTYVRVKLQRQSKQKIQFVPLTLKRGNEESSSQSIILENLNGYKLYLPVSLSSEQLVKLLNISGWNNA